MMGLQREPTGEFDRAPRGFPPMPGRVRIGTGSTVAEAAEAARGLV